mgnify:CR=1 FL=1
MYDSKAHQQFIKLFIANYRMSTDDTLQPIVSNKCAHSLPQQMISIFTISSGLQFLAIKFEVDIFEFLSLCVSLYRVRQISKCIDCEIKEEQKVKRIIIKSYNSALHIHWSSSCYSLIPLEQTHDDRLLGVHPCHHGASLWQHIRHQAETQWCSCPHNLLDSAR